ncbi:MurR/RpiR family transcriptional regulator [Rhodovibrionaceae bacterium A322]
MALRQRVTKHFEELSPQLQQAAEYLVAHSDAVATRSLRQIAGAAGLAPSTFSRLARALEFESFEGIRDLCRADLQREKLVFSKKAKALQDFQEGQMTPGKGAFVVAQASAAIGSIQELLTDLDLEDVAAAADLLASAPKVHILGVMGSSGLAEYLLYMARMAFTHWYPLGNANLSIAVTLEAVEPGDVVLVMSMYPYARRAIEIAELAQEKGAHLILITNAFDAPLRKRARHIIEVSTESPQFYASYVATVVMLESLMGMVLRRSGPEAQKRIEKIEQANMERGEIG